MFKKKYKTRYADGDLNNDPKTWGQLIRSYLWERPIQFFGILSVIIILLIFLKFFFNIKIHIPLPGGGGVNIEQIKGGSYEQTQRNSGSYRRRVEK